MVEKWKRIPAQLELYEKWCALTAEKGGMFDPYNMPFVNTGETSCRSSFFLTVHHYFLNGITVLGEIETAKEIVGVLIR